MWCVYIGYECWLVGVSIRCNILGPWAPRGEVLVGGGYVGEGVLWRYVQ